MKTHKLNLSFLALVGAVWLWPVAGEAVAPTESEMAEAARWAAAKFKAATDPAKLGPGLYVLANNDPPFAFTYDGRPSADLLKWAAEFTRDQATGLRITAGQEKPRFKLHSGEEFRTPLMALQFWKGDWIRAQNLWRRWMLAHNLPRPGGKLPPVQMAACSSHQFGEMIQANTANQELFVDRYLEEKLPLDYWWMDAGWYKCDGSWPKTGTWEVDTNRFVGGLRPISDHAHAKRVKTIVWFEPERVHSGTWLAENHPDWILGGKDGGLLNLGNPAAG